MHQKLVFFEVQDWERDILKNAFPEALLEIDKLSEELKGGVSAKIDALKKVKDTDNTEEIKQKTQELSQAIQKVGAELYKQQGGQTPPNGENKGPEEGEYKEKK